MKCLNELVAMELVKSSLDPHPITLAKLQVYCKTVSFTLCYLGSSQDV